MSRAERRAYARRNKGRDQTKKLDRTSYIIMAVITFAMIFSSFGYVLNYGGPVVGIGVLLFIGAVALALMLWAKYRDNDEVK